MKNIFLFAVISIFLSVLILSCKSTDSETMTPNDTLPDNTESEWKELYKISDEQFGWGTFYFQNMVLDDNGNAYIAWVTQYSNDGQYQAYIGKWDGTKFEKLGNGMFSDYVTVGIGAGAGLKLLVRNNIPYVAYLDGTNIIVKKYEGAQWVQQGDNIALADSEFDFAISAAGDLLIAYAQLNQTYDAMGKLTVKKLSSMQWTNVGTAQMSDNTAKRIDIETAQNGNIYVVYHKNTGDALSSCLIEMQAYSGSSWTKTQIAEENLYWSEPILTVFNNMPIVAYSDYNAKVSHLKKFEGTSWSNFGTFSDYFFGQAFAQENSTLYLTAVQGLETRFYKTSGLSWSEIPAAKFENDSRKILHIKNSVPYLYFFSGDMLEKYESTF